MSEGSRMLDLMTEYRETLRHNFPDHASYLVWAQPIHKAVFADPNPSPDSQPMLIQRLRDAPVRIARKMNELRFHSQSIMKHFIIKHPHAPLPILFLSLWERLGEGSG